MSLRLRLLIVVATTFMLVVIGCVYAAHVIAARQLDTATDEFLEQRADRFEHTPKGAYPTGKNDNGPTFPGGSRGGPDNAPPLADPDAITQLLATDGSVRTSIVDQPELPISAGDRELAQSGGTATFRDVTVDGEPFRMLTVALPDGGAAQVARSIDRDNDLLATLDTRLFLIALFGTVLVGSLAWLIARRTLRPVERLTQAASYVAETQDLENQIEVERNDEVGKLATSFNTMLVALRTSREQQRRLVVDASHELRTPLTALRTNIEVLQRTNGLTDEQRAELLAEANLELTELSDLVGELVELATDTRSEEPVQPVDLAELVEQVVARTQRRTERRLHVELRDPSVVDARLALIDRAVSNILDNAVKFSPRDTIIDVVVDRGSISVLDRGPGIAPGDRERVFDRFYRSDDTRTLPGSGLGLAIVSEIATLHHGTVTVEPRDGGGTVVTFSIPALTE